MSDPELKDVFAVVCAEYDRFTTNDAAGKLQLETIKTDLRQTYASKPRFLSSAAAICIDRYVASELDFATPNVRGMGRMSDHIPRFAAKHRNQFNNIRYDVLMNLRSSIKQHIMCGYLLLEFYYELPPIKVQRSDNEILFDQWISTIYLPPHELEPKCKDERDIRGIWFAATGRAIRNVSREAGLEWDVRDQVGTDQAIITHYFDAGITLRYAEAMVEPR